MASAAFTGVRLSASARVHGPLKGGGPHSRASDGIPHQRGIGKAMGDVAVSAPCVRWCTRTTWFMGAFKE
jgi:hypothetical protein